MAEEDIFLSRKKYVHICKLPKTPEVVDELIPHDNIFLKSLRKFCLLSHNVSHRSIYTKSTRELEKERRYHLIHHYFLIHPFSDFSYFWGNFMLIINAMQLIIAPITIINRLNGDTLTMVLIFTLFMGNVNIIIQFCTGYYRYDVKEVILEPKKIAINYLKTFFIPDFVGNFPLRTTMEFFDIDASIRFIFKILIAFNAANFIRNLEKLREKRDLDLVVVKLLSCFAIAAIGLIWFSALTSLTAHRINSKVSMWRLLYVNFILMTGSCLEAVYDDYELIVRTGVLIFGFVIRAVLLVQLILFFKTYDVNKLNKIKLMEEIKEFCHFKKLPANLTKKIYDLYEFKFQNVYYNEEDIWALLSESMRQSLLDYTARQWFQGDIFKLCPLALRQLITLNLNKQYYLKGDTIYKIEDYLNTIYFIKSGTVCLNDPNGKLVHIMQQGNFISSRALLFFHKNVPHMYAAVAAENCYLFSLTTEAFRKIIKNFPEDYEVIVDILTKRLDFMIRTTIINKDLKLTDYYEPKSDSEKQ